MITSDVQKQMLTNFKNLVKFVIFTNFKMVSYEFSICEPSSHSLFVL